MDNLKSQFTEWINNAKKQNGELYSEDTKSNYIGALENYCEKLGPLNLEFNNLFFYTNIKEFDKAEKTIKSCPDYESFNSSRNRIFSSALKIYRIFLNSISNRGKFEYWLGHYPDKKYRDSTVNRYLVALDKCEERLEIKLSVFIWDVNSVESFERIDKEIKNSERFLEVNKAYGNGDLSAALTAYRKFILDYYNNQWFPSVDDYNPNISKEQWLQLLKKEGFLTDKIRYTLAAFYKNGGQASCVELEEKFGNSSDFYRNCGGSFGERVVKETGVPKFGEKDAAYWPIAFLGRDAKPEERGNYIWKLRPELYDALTEFGIWKYLSNAHETGRFYSWEIVDETTAIKTCDKSFFEFSGSGIPKEICWFFGFDNAQVDDNRDVVLSFAGKDYKAHIKNDSTDRTRTTISWYSNLSAELAKIRKDNISVVFRKTSENKYELSVKGSEASMTTKQMLDEIKKYIAARGFTYEGSLIENFYLSLKSKPFVILAGTSGTGKTKLAEYFADAVGGKKELVPVRPDWSDSSDLFGHVNLKGEFTAGAIIGFIKEANENKGKPYFLIFDEMNLARVEYYMSDFLSVLETRKRSEANNEIITAPLFKDSIFGNDESALKKYSGLTIPDNLYIIGTVNMDETTFPFSKKVLDRANTIEFSYVDLSPAFEYYGSVENIPIQNDFMKPTFIKLQECIDYKDVVQKTCDELVRINEKLKIADLHVGYRIRDDFCFYMINRETADILSFDEAFDNQIMQKILPRIQGSSSSVKEVIQELFKICAGDYTGMADNGSINESMKHFIETKRDQCKYYKSAEKLVYMMRRYEEDGFTSYWL